MREAVLSGTLTSTKGKFVKQLEQQFAAKLGVKHAYACASGTAAVHCAIAAINPEPGDEIVTTSITDMGALTPILYQGAIPVFAEVDPETCNITAEDIEPCLSDRTKAIVVTHLFGSPCEMREIMELADSRNIPVIEDCAQSFLAQHRGQYVGGIGKIGCFSLQQGKHITTGEGGIVTTNDDALARRMYHFINKAWGYEDPQPDHYFIALNYRMCELQGAVAVAQLRKLSSIVEDRISAAQRLTRKLAGLDGIKTPHVSPEDVHVYWKYCLRVDAGVIPGGSVGLAGKLKSRGIACAPRYIQKPAFMCQIFRDKNTFGNSHYPFTLARPEVLDYDPARFPKTTHALEQVLVLPFTERYQEKHIDYIADSILDAVNERETV